MKKARRLDPLPFMDPSPETGPHSYEILRNYMSPERERRSARTTVCFTPSLAAKLKEVADATGESVNNLIHMILEQHLDEYIP